MIFRDFGDDVEKVAADWASRVFADPDEFVNEDGKTLGEIAAKGQRGRLGAFTYQGKFTCYAKAHPLLGGKIVSDLCFHAGLPVCPEILVEDKTSPCWYNDEEVGGRLIRVSLDPFSPSTGCNLKFCPEIATVATVIDTLVGTKERKNDDNCCPTYDDDLVPGKIGLFDFETAFLSKFESSFDKPIKRPDGVGISDLLPDWGFETVKRLMDIPAETYLAFFQRIPLHHIDGYPSYLSDIPSVLERHHKLPEIFDDLFGTASLKSLQRPSDFKRTMALATKLQK